MALSRLVVKAARLQGKDDILAGLMDWTRKNFVGSVFVSCCPKRRKEIKERFPHVWLVNPFKSSRKLGEFYGFFGDDSLGLVWIDEWPALISPRFNELRQKLLSEQAVVVAGQSLSLPEEGYYWQVFTEDQGPWIKLYHQRLAPMPIIPFKHLIVGRQRGEGRGFLVERPFEWPREPGLELFVPFDFEEHSFLYELHHQQHLILMATCRKSLFVFLRTFPDVLLAWLLSGHMSRDLISSPGEDKNRRHPRKEKPLSRKAHHRHSSLKKWSSSFCDVLRWARRRKET